MTELAASGIPVTVTGRVLTLFRQPYYRWLVNPIMPVTTTLPRGMPQLSQSFFSLLQKTVPNRRSWTPARS